MNDTEFPEKAILARNLVRAREERGLGQRELARLAKINRGYVLNMEAGTANPSLEKLSLLARVLGCTIPELLSDGQ